MESGEEIDLKSLEPGEEKTPEISSHRRFQNAFLALMKKSALNQVYPLHPVYEPSTLLIIGHLDAPKEDKLLSNLMPAYPRKKSPLKWLNIFLMCLAFRLCFYFCFNFWSHPLFTMCLERVNPLSYIPPLCRGT